MSSSSPESAVPETNPQTAPAAAPHAAQHNALAHASSAYLRSAMHQPVDWQRWGEAAFDRAVREDKPVLLDIGAVWCHWCHVMDRESYEDPATAQIINDHFIAIKVDRDERPDVDTRYQAAVSSISGQGGWPLTAFLTPDGRPYFGGTYFPPEERHGRPSLRRVLLTMAEAYQTRREEVEDSAQSVIAAIEHNESFASSAPDPGSELVDKLIASALRQFDGKNGGFGSQPKFPHPGALDLLIDAASRSAKSATGSNDASQAQAARLAAMVTLEKMSKGGIYDHLAGGFHRYSVDERWVVPHFEKMAYDNSELLKSYVHAFASFAEPECARVSREIIGWIDQTLSDREEGGFYASQDADDSLDDDGDYFTWTQAEAAAVLTPTEMSVAGLYYDIGEMGDMHHNPLKNVLHVTKTLEAISAATRLPVDEARVVLGEARRKLFAARQSRRTPYVDRTIYTAWNAMLISAYFEAARALDLPEVRAFALKSLNRVLASAWSEATGVAHVVAYGEVADPATIAEASRVPGILDDYVFLGHAALDAWEATGELRFYTIADQIATSTLDRFYDTKGEAFFDTAIPAAQERRIGALTTRRKPLQDSPTPAANPVAAALLLRLEALNGNTIYRERAQRTLEAFAAVVEHFGLYAASYGLALRRLVEPPIQICIIGSKLETPEEPSVKAAVRALEIAAMSPYLVNKTVIRLDRSQLHTLPPHLAATLPNLPMLQQDRHAVAIVCTGHSCQPPVYGPDQLTAVLHRISMGAP